MKVAVLCVVFSVLGITSSQPTYDPKQQELCDGVCQQQDLQTLQKQFAAQFTAMNNIISQLQEQVNRVLHIYTGHSGNTVNGTELPAGYPTSPSCPENLNFTYIPSVRGCYHVVLDKLRRAEANERCISLHPDAHLVIINSHAEQTELSDLLHKQKNIGDYWTAGHRVNVTNTPSSFIWRLQTANYYAKLPISYDGWAPNQPNDSHGSGFCVMLYHIQNYMWADYSCRYYINSVCEIDIA